MANKLIDAAKASQMKSKPSKTNTPDNTNRNVDGAMGSKKYSNNQGTAKNKVG